mmetsp:Transcript_7220/g.7934  ORF Transcript_7220/g.7934 Transcript_7220/m.7934 type:complete len:183 (-) Transcript_7220:354-902(-)
MESFESQETNCESWKSKLEKVLHLQEKRAETYKRWDKNFKEYAETKDEKAFTESLKEINGVFGSVSKDIIEIENDLKNSTSSGEQPGPAIEISQRIRQLQLLEKSHLEQATKLLIFSGKVQSFRENFCVATGNEKHFLEEDLIQSQEEYAQAKTSLDYLLEEINDLLVLLRDFLHPDGQDTE